MGLQIITTIEHHIESFIGYFNYILYIKIYSEKLILRAGFYFSVPNLSILTNIHHLGNCWFKTLNIISWFLFLALIIDHHRPILDSIIDLLIQDGVSRIRGEHIACSPADEQCYNYWWESSERMPQWNHSCSSSSWCSV